MTPAFLTAVNRVLSHEGGYVNHPRDPGGETNWGVTVGVARENGFTGSMRGMTRDDAVRIYEKCYWNRVRGDDLGMALGFQVFDAAVNHGAGNAIRWLQRAAGVADDGRLGPATLAAARARTAPDMCLLFNEQRLAFYTNLSTWPTFGKGWARRIAGNLRWAALDA